LQNGWLQKLLIIILAAWAGIGVTVSLEARPQHLDIAAEKVVPSKGQVFFLEDPKGLLTFDDVLAKGHEFVTAPKDEINMGFTESAYWFWFEVKNSSANEVTRYVEIANPVLDHIDLFLIDEEKKLIRHDRSGDLLPFRERPVDYANFVFPIKLAPHSVRTVLLKVQTGGTLGLPLTFWSPQLFDETSRTTLLFQGVWAGSLLIMIFYNLFVYLSVRRISYLFYIIQMVGYIFFVFTMRGFTFQYIFPDYPDLTNMLVSTSMAFPDTFAALFAISFLGLRRSSRPLYLFLMGFVWPCGVLIFLGPFLPYAPTVTFLTAASVSVFFASLLVGLIRLYAGQKEARFFVLAWTSYVIGNMIYGATKFDLLPINFITDNVQQIGSLLEAVLLSFALADKLNTLKAEHLSALEEKRKAQDQLLQVQQNAIQSLDQEVEEKTWAIQTILQNMKNGFLVVDSRGCIQSGFTQSCHDLFGKTVLEHAQLVDYLGLSQRDAESFTSALGQVFEDLLPEMVSLAQINELYVVGGKTLSLQGSVIRGSSGGVQYIIFTVTDKSGQIAAEMKSQQNETLLKIIRSRESFRVALMDFFRTLEQVKVGRFTESSWRVYLHTLKGIFSCYGLSDIARKIHQIEDKAAISEQDWSDIAGLITGFYEANRRVLDIDLSRGEWEGRKILVADAMIREMCRDLKSSHSIGQFRDRVDFWFSELSGSPVAVFLGELPTYAKSLAQRLGKQVRVTIEGGDVRVSHPEAVDVITNLVHLVRNAVDHGIEDPGSRGDKDPVGEIRLSFEKSGEWLTIKVKDDGRGVDFEKIRDSAAKHGYFKDGNFSLEKDFFHMLAQYSISTRDVITEVSGRGVGIKAIADAVQKAGGSLALDTHPGQFTQITITLNLVTHVANYGRAEMLAG
jgi:signal transduction histidine kinase